MDILHPSSVTERHTRMKARILQGLAIIVIFILGCLFWGGGSAPSEGTTDSSGYVPPAP